MLTVAQFRQVFTANGGIIVGKVIQKMLKDSPDKQLFALMLNQKEVRHFLVNLIEKRIYEGSLYFKEGANQLIFGYLDFPPISYHTNDLQVRESNTKKKD